jgi:uncharacterized membrane protein YgcG
MAVDLLGGIFSILSLIFKNRVDVPAAVAYSLVVVRRPPRPAQVSCDVFSLTSRVFCLVVVICIAQVMDGLVLVLAIILNPRTKRAVQRGEQKSRASACGGDGDGSGGDHGGGTARVTAISGGLGHRHDNKERSAEEDHLELETPITV